MEQEEFINSIGEELADTMKFDFYGSVRFNIQGGRYIGANIERSVKPTLDKRKISATTERESNWRSELFIKPNKQ